MKLIGAVDRELGPSPPVGQAEEVAVDGSDKVIVASVEHLAGQIFQNTWNNFKYRVEHLAGQIV